MKAISIEAGGPGWQVTTATGGVLRLRVPTGKTGQWRAEWWIGDRGDVAVSDSPSRALRGALPSYPDSAHALEAAMLLFDAAEEYIRDPGSVRARSAALHDLLRGAGFTRHGVGVSEPKFTGHGVGMLEDAATGVTVAVSVDGYRITHLCEGPQYGMGVVDLPPSVTYQEVSGLALALQAAGKVTLAQAGQDPETSA